MIGGIGKKKEGGSDGREDPLPWMGEEEGGGDRKVGEGEEQGLSSKARRNKTSSTTAVKGRLGLASDP